MLAKFYTEFGINRSVITTGVLTKICKGLQCDISDIMEMIDVKEMARKDKSEE